FAIVERTTGVVAPAETDVAGAAARHRSGARATREIVIDEARAAAAAEGIAQHDVAPAATEGIAQNDVERAAVPTCLFSLTLEIDRRGARAEAQAAPFRRAAQH